MKKVYQKACKLTLLFDEILADYPELRGTPNADGEYEGIQVSVTSSGPVTHLIFPATYEAGIDQIVADHDPLGSSQGELRDQKIKDAKTDLYSTLTKNPNSALKVGDLSALITVLRLDLL